MWSNPTNFQWGKYLEKNTEKDKYGHNQLTEAGVLKIRFS